jgi:hypothetical protein
MDIWLRRVWLLIGVGVILNAAWNVGKEVWYMVWRTDDQTTSNGIRVGDAAKPQTADSLVRQQLHYGYAEKVAGTSWYYFELKTLALPIHLRRYVSNEATSASIDWYNTPSNIVFTKLDGSQPRLLLDTIAAIVGHWIPTDPYQGGHPNYCLFEIVLEDTNGDSVLNSEDMKTTWISNLDGTGMTKIADSNEVVDALQEIGSRVLVTKRIPFPGVELKFTPARIWEYFPVQRSLTPLAELDSVTDIAERRLWGG